MTQGVCGEPKEAGSRAQMSFGRSGRLTPIYLKMAEGDGADSVEGTRKMNVFHLFMPKNVPYSI